MKLKKDKLLNIFFIILLISILILPKINIISIAESRTGIRIDDICVLIYFMYFIYKYIIKKITINDKIQYILKYFSICIAIFTISTILGVLRGNVSLVLSFLHLIRNIEYFVLIFAGYDYVKNSKNKNSLLRIFNYVLIFHGIYMILEYFNIIGDIGYLIGRPGNDRIYTTFSGPYEFSAFLTLLLPIYLIKVFKDKQYFNIFYIAIVLLGVLISKSRISLIACVFIILIAFCIEFKSKNKKKILISSLIVCVIMFVVALNTEMLSRFESIDISSSISTFISAWENADFEYYKDNGVINYDETTLNSTSDLSYALRVSKWATLLKETIKTPILGLGVSVVGEATDGNYVRLLAETGIFGLIAWLILIAVVVRELYKLKNIFWAKVNLYNIISLLIIAIFIDVFASSKVMMIFWFMVGATFSYEERKKEESDRKTKILHVVSGINFGGVETVLYNYFSNMKNLNNYENVIISHEKIDKKNAELFKKINFKFYEVTPKRENVLKNVFELDRIIKKEEPDIVHVHMTLSSYLALFIAYLNEVKVRICHSHLALPKMTKIEKIYKILCNCFANEYFACTKDASDYLFTKKNSSKVHILENAINIQKFDFNIETRKKIREELNINNKFVIGNIGRFTEQKNHERIISIFNEFLKKNQNTVLLLIGEGYLKENIIQKVEKLNVKDKVLFLDTVSDVEKYYNAMDLFLFPSLYEGFGIVAIEAQTSGLPCIVSDVVPKDIKLSELVTFINLNESNEIWVENILKHEKYTRKSNINLVKNTKYDIIKQANELDKIYQEIII